MQGGRNPFFGFGDPFGSFGGQRSLVSNFFGGNDPFDDPFFTRPFGSMFESSFFGSNGAPFMNPLSSGFLQHQPAQPNVSRGLVIEDLNSDDEADETDKKENPRKHGRSGKEPFVEEPDDEATDKKSKHMGFQNEIYQMQNARSQPQTQSFTFQSTTVSYGGANGPYYTSSRTRRSGSDGVIFEECKEADSSTRQATHRVSRGIHNKGHSISRKLGSDGHVDTMQTLHNINEDELAGFEETWKGNARKYIPGLGEGFVSEEDATGSGSTNQNRHSRTGWALPSTERSNLRGSSKPNIGGRSAAPRPSARAKNNVSRSSRSRSNENGSTKPTNNRH